MQEATNACTFTVVGSHKKEDCSSEKSYFNHVVLNLFWFKRTYRSQIGMLSKPQLTQYLKLVLGFHIIDFHTIRERERKLAKENNLWGRGFLREEEYVWKCCPKKIITFLSKYKGELCLGGGEFYFFVGGVHDFI